ncbi:hypothetical protein QE197_24430 (plasmid) [Arsenophonus nasoniae]|uniref:hypothetical protein n=1 Tax=Arsenophonus nasoniae TaxID=638 RepID=UPI002468B0C8|nr:hypothetical protein [Arsenophonus nasoniae]WGM13599.1 hypothetical protein QE197_24430 [Arsenophonus nasoniae]WGM18342.1 hypothetical protein QE193_24700 [Arsenophonus nasoniae]
MKYSVYTVTTYYRGLVLEQTHKTLEDALEYIKTEQKVGTLNLKRADIEVKNLKI